MKISLHPSIVSVLPEMISGFLCLLHSQCSNLHPIFRAEILNYIVQKANDVFIVSDSSKFGKTELTNICYPADIQHIATNSDVPASFQEEFKKAGIVILA